MITSKNKDKTEGAIVAVDTKLGVTKITPIPELTEAFKIFECGFKIGAIYGFECRKVNRTSKQLIKFLETDEARQMIYALLLKEGGT